jgi:hypothetical protein
MHAAIDPQKVSKVLGEVHLIDAFLTTRLRNFTCYRCKRSLPEGQFAYLGPRFIKSSRRPLSALHPHCHKCREQENGEWVKHPLYSPELDRFWKVKFISVRSSALNRDIFLGVEYQDLLGKHLEQEGRCALTGMEMKLVDVGGTNVKSGRNLAAPSVDRIDCPLVSSQTWTRGLGCGSFYSAALRSRKPQAPFWSVMGRRWNQRQPSCGLSSLQVLSWLEASFWLSLLRSRKGWRPRRAMTIARETR